MTVNFFVTLSVKMRIFCKSWQLLPVLNKFESYTNCITLFSPFADFLNMLHSTWISLLTFLYCHKKACDNTPTLFHIFYTLDGIWAIVLFFLWQLHFFNNIGLILLICCQLWKTLSNAWNRSFPYRVTLPSDNT